MVYEIDQKVGRKDSRDIVKSTAMNVTTTPSLLPATPLGRRNYIKVKNTDGVNDVAITTSSGDNYAAGYPVGLNGSEWEAYTDGVLYVVSSAGTVAIKVFERSQRFNYK
jgi:hypothetical protein